MEKLSKENARYKKELLKRVSKRKLEKWLENNPPLPKWNKYAFAFARMPIRTLLETEKKKRKE